MPKKFLAYNRPFIGEEEIREVADTLRSGWLVMGKKTLELERMLQRYTGARHAIALNSCTDALELSLRALGIKGGDEVITTTYTFAATANVIVHTGAKPVFVDINTDTYNIDPEGIADAVTPRTKAIMSVDFAGQPCDIKAINEIAEKNDLFVVEDAAHSIGAEYNGKKIGKASTTTCFSFYATKNITTGEGGAITTQDRELAEKFRILRLHGISEGAWNRYAKGGKWFYEIEDFGWNCVMTDIQASLGIHQMKRLGEFIETRRRYARIYNEELGHIEGLITPFEAKNVRHPYHLYPLLVEGIERSKFIEEMNMERIATSVHFIPLHLHPAYKKRFGLKKGSFRNAEWVYEREVSLPLYPKMSEEEVKRVVSAIKKIMHRAF